MQRSDQKGYFPSMFYGDIINKAKKFKSETSKDFELVLICQYLRQVYFSKYRQSASTTNRSNKQLN